MSSSFAPRRSRLVAASASGLLALVGSVAVSTPAVADDDRKCEKRNNNSLEKLLECVTAKGAMEHMQAFQEIADAHDGTRASGTKGYDASADYVEGRLEKAGYTVARQSFDFDYYELKGTPSLAQTAPEARGFVYGEDFLDMSFSGAGALSGTAVGVDTASGNSGCEAADFADFTAGSIALIKRGACAFGTKASNAETAGAVAVIIYNDGTSPDRTGLVNGTLGAPVGIPTLFTTTAIGSTLDGATLDLSIDTISETRTTENVLAELPGKTSDNVVMAGAHLDSVAAGPGINDNGSGSAGILEVAENMAKVKPQNTVRFAWWGAEELGLVGSEHYVASLEEKQKEDIALYLNFDMIGSPNFARFIYDGDQSDFVAPVPVPEGSAQIEGIFERFYDSNELTYEGTEFSGRSDYQAFINSGIPSGGLFTGAEGIKSEAQAARYGGTAGTAFDPCYHQACDTIANVDTKVLGQNADAVAYSVLSLAYSTEEVNGVKGKKVKGLDDDDDDRRSYRADAEGDAGGGLHAGHDHGQDLATS